MDELAYVASQQRFELQLVADLVCPWSRIVWHRLSELRRELPLTLRWRPFLLNPHLPPQGISRRYYLERRFGGGTAAMSLFHHVTLAGSKDGLQFRFEQIDRQPDTASAHALLLAAAERGLAEPMTELLFHAFFEQGADLGDAKVLAEMLDKAGLPSTLLASSCAPGRLEAVRRAHREIVALGIDGVPTLVAPGIGMIGGAHPPAVLRAFAEVAIMSGAAMLEERTERD